MIRRIGLAVGAALLALVIGFVVVAGGRSMLRTTAALHPVKIVAPRPAAVGGFARLEDVSFRSPAGLLVRGWYVPTRNGASVILGHGIGSNRAQLLPEARTLAEAGYGVLLFDWPAHGESEGDLVTWGDRERGALVAALDWLVQQPSVDPDRIGALGFSMGGSVVVGVAAKDQRLRALVVEATFTSLEEEARWSERHFGVISGEAAVLAEEAAGINLSAVRPVAELCSVAPRPVLVIVNDADPNAPIAMERRLVAAACGPAELFVLRGTWHGGYSTTSGEVYRSKLLEFFGKSLGPSLPRRIGADSQ